MKNIFFPVLFGVLLTAALPVYGQKGLVCGTPTPSKPLVFDHKKQDKTAAGPYVFNIFVHILRNDDGSNAAMSDATLQTNLNRMAAFFRPHDICFTFVGRDFIDNTTWNTNYTIGLINDLHAVNPHSDAIDIYVHANNFDNSGGNAYDIPSPKVSVAAPSSFNFEHEIGHALGLLHTFASANGNDECPDGSNCNSAGDLVCDTEADFPDSQDFGSGCSYTGTQTIDCNSSTFDYDPPTSNIMSYWASCYNEFTDGQASRMYNTINATGFLQDRLTPVDVIISGTTLTGEIAVGAQNSIQMGNIAAAGDVLMNGNAHGIFNAGAYIQAIPGTRIAPTGTNEILLTINGLCDGLLLKSDLTIADRNSEQSGFNGDADDLAVYPNPFRDKINIRVRLDIGSPATFKLFDMAGSLIRSFDNQDLLETGNFYRELELPDLRPGIYALRFQQGEKLQTIKLVKLE